MKPFLHKIIAVRILNFPAASFMGKLERDKLTTTLAPAVFAALNTFFNENKDEIFKEVVVADFLFRGIKDGIVDWLMNGPLAIFTHDRLPEAFRSISTILIETTFAEHLICRDFIVKKMVSHYSMGKLTPPRMRTTKCLQERLVGINTL